MSNLSDITLSAHDGSPARIGDLVERPTIVVIPRYYGCMPCRDYLRQVSDRYDEIERADGAALGVSVGADYQASWLIEKYGISFPLLVDPERRLYDALELGRKLSVALNPRGWARYARAIARGNRQGKIIEPIQQPGLALLGAGAEVEWVHRGRTVGDYPPLDEVIERLRALAPAGA